MSRGFNCITRTRPIRFSRRTYQPSERRNKREQNLSRIRCWKNWSIKLKQIGDNGDLFYASLRWGMVLGQALRPRARTLRLVPELLRHGSSHQSLPPSLSPPPSHPRRRMRQLRSVPPPITAGSLNIIQWKPVNNSNWVSPSVFVLITAFSEGMVDDGYEEVVSIDISSVVIEAMQKKHSDRPQLTCIFSPFLYTNFVDYCCGRNRIHFN